MIQRNADMDQTSESHPMFELTVPANATDHTIGPAHASVTVIEYGDFECPNCKQAAPAVKLLLKRFAGRIRFVYRPVGVPEFAAGTRGL